MMSRNSCETLMLDNNRAAMLDANSNASLSDGCRLDEASEPFGAETAKKKTNKKNEAISAAEQRETKLTLASIIDVC